jgi:hypothetical protein
MADVLTITCMIFLDICNRNPATTPESLTDVVFPNVTPNAERYDDKDSHKCLPCADSPKLREICILAPNVDGNMLEDVIG